MLGSGMLTCLTIRDFAIIDELQLELGPGLNVLTGETGSGKSILVSALELVLGGKGRPEHVRAGADRAEVEALFDISSDQRLLHKLAAWDVSDDELIVRRVVMPNGRTRAFVNGRLATREQLAEVTRGLTDISSQHQHHTLTDPSTHLSYLDAFGRLGVERQQVRAAYHALEKASSVLLDFEARLRDRSTREAMLRKAVEEIEALDPRLGEDAALETESSRLCHTETRLKLMSEAAELLYERDESVVDLLAQAGQRLMQVTALDPAIEALSDRLESARVSLQDAARELAHQLHSLHPDPEALGRAEQRLFHLDKLKRRYGGTLAAVLEHLERCHTQLDEFGHHHETGDALRAAQKRALEGAMTSARALSAKRRRAATRLAVAITNELGSLGMGEARVRVQVKPLTSQGGEGFCSAPAERLGPNGMDTAEFLIAPNLGEAALPLHKVASGGELSRAMLAIKCVLADLGPAGMYAFDEVDSGVGGGMAEVIGRKVQLVARHRQVLCITHLPQIAVFADHHFKVEKSLRGERTLSVIRKLSAREQGEEIARMLGGLKITGKTRAAARELLQQARSSAA